MTTDTRFGRRAFIGGLATGAAVLSAPALLRAQTPQVVKIGTPTLNDAQHEWMKIFAKKIEDGSDGAFKTELYPASQLGSAPRMIEGAQFGSVQVVILPPEFLAGVAKPYEIMSAPGVFNDFDHACKVMADPGFNAAFLALGADRGLKGVGLFGNSQITVNCRTELKTADDVSGKKIRVLGSEMQSKQIDMLGGTPVPMPLDQVLTAVQQGTIDGVLGSLPVLAAFHFYNGAPWILDTQHATVTVVSVASKMWYDALSDELKAVVDKAGAEASLEVKPWAVDFNDKQYKAWTDNGGTVTPVSDADRAALRARLKPIGEEVAAKDPAEKTLYELMVKTAEATA